VDPAAARSNYARLADMGALGRYGFYEALDFTRSRLPDNEQVAIVRNFMAHHQGMSIVAIANVLHDGLMRSRFHHEPIIQASELLLQERIPRDIVIAHPRAEEVKASAAVNTDIPAVRRVVLSAAASVSAPITHLLSNGRYAVMLTGAKTLPATTGAHSSSCKTPRADRYGPPALSLSERAPSTMKSCSAKITPHSYDVTVR
jgi:cyclic beta-1,2-glucan synthetase